MGAVPVPGSSQSAPGRTPDPVPPGGPGAAGPAAAVPPSRRRLAALALCLDGDRLLLVPARAPYGGLRRMPTSAPRAGEGLADACRRAVAGALGRPPEAVALRVLADLTLWPDAAAHRPAPPLRWTLAVFFCRPPAGGRPAPGAAWRSVAGLAAGDVLETDRRLAADGLAAGPYAVFRLVSARLQAGRASVLHYA